MAIGFNNVQSAVNDDGSTVTEASYVVGAETNRILVAVVSITQSGADRAVTGVVFNTSEAFTLSVRRLDDDGSGTRAVTEIWHLLNPSNATANVVATIDGTCEGLGLSLLYLDNAKQAAPEVVSNGQDLATPFTLSITTLTDAAAIIRGCVLADDAGGVSALTGSGQTGDTSLDIDPTFHDFGGMGHEIKATAGAEDGGWTYDGGTANHGTLVAASFAHFVEQTFIAGALMMAGL